MTAKRTGAEIAKGEILLVVEHDVAQFGLLNAWVCATIGCATGFFKLHNILRVLHDGFAFSLTMAQSSTLSEVYRGESPVVE